jgi:hypothetical protein
MKEGKKKGPAGWCRYILTSRNLDHEIRQAKEKVGGGTSSCRNSGRGHSAAVILPPRRARGAPTSRYKSTGIAAVDIIPTASFKQSSFQEVLSHSNQIISGSPNQVWAFIYWADEVSLSIGFPSFLSSVFFSTPCIFYLFRRKKNQPEDTFDRRPCKVSQNLDKSVTLLFKKGR